MLVKLLQVTIYPDSGWDWWTEDIPNPSWEDIEASIRRLDRFRYPFIMLFRKPHIEEDEYPDLNVMGGDGLFAFDCIADGTEYRYHDPTRSDREIAIWLSDQGAVFEERYICESIDTVLGAVQYFCEHGQPDSSLTWEVKPQHITPIEGRDDRSGT